jgi:hypothetical protein
MKHVKAYTRNLVETIIRLKKENSLYVYKTMVKLNLEQAMKAQRGGAVAELYTFFNLRAYESR